MLNVNELTSRMAKMSDAQLRQYAQLHKNDPYVLALAASESKRRAQLRASAQQQMAQGPQPTVADQALAEMGAPAPRPQLPEEQGIGVLPAENMAGMANGGIAGYGDSYADEYAAGGMVAFAGGGIPTLSEFDQGNVPLTGAERTLLGASDRVNAMMQKQREDALRQQAAFKLQKYTSLGGYFFEPQTQQERKTRELISANLDKIPLNELEAFVKEGKLPSVAVPSTTPPPVTEASPDKASQESKPKPQAVNIPAERKQPANRPGTSSVKMKPDASTTVPGFEPSKPGDLATELKRLQSMNPGTAEYDALLKRVEEGYANLEKEAQAGKPKGKAYEGLESLLGKEEERAKGKEARNLNMALVNAGLAIAGGRSQYALQNIAEGAQVGTKQYQEGLEKLEAAALERRKQAAMIEEARRAEERGDWKEASERKRKAFEAGLGVKQAQIAAVQDLYKTDLKGAIDFVNTANTIASAEKRSAFEQAQETLRSRERNEAHLAGQRMMAAAYGARSDQRGELTPALMLKEYNDRVAVDPVFAKKYPNFQTYVLSLQGPQVVSQIPENAQVRK